MVRSRRGPDADMLVYDPEDLPSDDDEYDPDYSEGESTIAADDLPPSMGRDRAQWIEDNVEAVEDLYRVFKEAGRELWGQAFYQTGDVTTFAKFVYKYTTPGAA